MSNPPFCVDCVHRSKLLGSDMCNRTTDKLDIITGRHEVLFMLCNRQREEPHWLLQKETCGEDGRFFQQNTSVWYRIKKWVSSFSK